MWNIVVIHLYFEEVVWYSLDYIIPQVTQVSTKNFKLTKLPNHMRLMYDS